MQTNSIPKVWKLTTTELWLAPSLDEAIEAAMKLSGLSRDEVIDPVFSDEPVSDEVLSELSGFYDAFGNEQTGLEAYQERLANGATVEPFGVIGED